jgi:hypothetical protein
VLCKWLRFQLLITEVTAYSAGPGADFECVHDEWYPAVGVDSSNAIHINFGQEPFVNDAIVGESRMVGVVVWMEDTNNG